MWSSLLQQWTPNSDFCSNYDFSEPISNSNHASLWTLYSATKKSTKEPVSLFKFTFKDQSSQRTELARQSLKRFKTIRHPSVVKYIDSHENDKYIALVTEFVEPLSVFMETDRFTKITSQQRDFFVGFGIVTIARGLNFLNNDCQLNHNNVNIHTVLVNSAGIFKIGSMEYVCPIGESPPPRCDNLCEKYIPPERLQDAKVKQGHKFSPDSWCLGCLVWEIFNKPLTPTSSLRTVGKMPRSLGVIYNKLTQTSPKNRISPMAFIEECKNAHVLFDSPNLETATFIEEIHLVKDPNEMSRHFAFLEKQLDSFPIYTCKYKILPDLINALEFAGASSTVLDPLFKIGQMLDEQEYQKLLVPHISKFFASKDRSIRYKLLQLIDTFVNYIPEKMINDEIFPQMVKGFNDPHFNMRDLTIKSSAIIAPKLNYTNLNTELLNNVIRLMYRDPDQMIRAGATVCLGKTAKYLDANNQEQIFINAMVKMLSDPFAGTRHVAICALSTNKDLISDKDRSTKVMPSLCPVCDDPDPEIKVLAIKSLRMFLAHFESKESAVNVPGIEKLSLENEKKHKAVPEQSKEYQRNGVGFNPKNESSGGKILKPRKPLVVDKNSPIPSRSPSPLSSQSSIHDKSNKKKKKEEDKEEDDDDEDWGDSFT